MSTDHSIRVLDEQLGYDGDMRLLNDKPFSGIGYSEYKNGQLELENTYREGLPNGLQREWYKSGQLKSESHSVRGSGSSKVTTWYENGEIASIKCYEFGVKVKDKEWDENGELIKNEVITPSPALQTYIARMKKIKGD